MDNNFAKLDKFLGTTPQQAPTQQFEDEGQQGLANWIDDMVASNPQQPQVQYPNPDVSIEDQINALPNADKLSGFERWVYKKLPGFAQSSVGKALETFADSPVGKALGVIDIFAEGLERTLGVASQYLVNAEEGEQIRFKDAWAAGSLFWDTVQAPKIKRDADGKMIGITIDDAMPGTVALREARKLIGEGKSIEEVREMYYSNLGALALRAQKQDALGHIFADPLNFATALVKPIESLHAIRALALTGKMDIAQMTKAAESLRVLGDVAGAVKVEGAIADAQKAGKALTRFDKFAIALTGGQPYMQNLQDATKSQAWLAKLNPFALTPQARASELLDVVAANVGEYLIRPNWQKDPEVFLKTLQAAARGSIGGEWGHLASTIQGRTVQSILAQADEVAVSLGHEWKLYAGERSIMQQIAAVLPGTDERKIWKMATESPDLLMKKIVAAAQQPGGEVIAKALQDGVLTPKTLENIAAIDAKTPLLLEEFYTKALVSIQDVAMQQSILQFGIKEKGVLTKWADALKAWETLPFIKANPANMVRNIVNNDMTLIGRGLFGTMTTKQIKKFWDGKWMPPQLSRAFSFKGADEFDSTVATQRLVQTLEGSGDSLPQKIKAAANNVKLGKFDFSEYSQQAEAAASVRASTMGWLQFHQQYWNPKTGFTGVAKYLDTDTLEEIERVAPGLTRILDEVAETAGTDSAKFAELMGSEIEHNVSTIMKNVEDAVGYKVTDVLGADTIQRIHDEMPKAIKSGKVREFVSGLQAEMEKHVDDMFNDHVQNLPGIIAAQVQAGGPLQYHRIFGKAMDEFWAGNTEHAIRMSSINELMDYAQRTGDYKKVGQMWDKIFTDGEAHFGRVWKKFDAYQEGLRQGAKNAGIKYPDEIANSFDGVQKGWREFFDYRNSEYKKFFGTKLEGAEYKKTLEQVQGEVDRMYRNMIGEEDRLYQQVDDLMANMVEDPTMRKMYMNYRDTASQLRIADRKATTDFYRQLRGASAKEAPDMWAKYWQDRIARVEQMRQVELRGSAALQGDAASINQFMGAQDKGQDADNIFGLASQYGISSTTKKGGRNDRRVVNTVNKYLKDNPNLTGRQIMEASPINPEVKSAYVAWDDTRIALEEAQATEAGKALEEISTDVVQQARIAEKAAREAYEETLKRTKTDKGLINKLIEKREFMRADGIPLDLARQAFEARAAEQTGQVAAAAQKSFIPDAERLFPDPMPIETGLSEMNYGRTYAVMDSLVDEAVAQSQTKSRLLKDLPATTQKKVQQWAKNVEDEMSSFRAAGVQFAAFRRDSALLNYNRRTNFDNMVGHIAPFAFWTTHSVMNWAVHSLDRPAMLTSYMRAREFFETAGLPDQKVPSRLKGHIRVQLPFTPDWMGDTFVNPGRFLLPFDAWAAPFEQAQNNKFSIESKTKNTLNDMLEQGLITESEYNEALETQEGVAWERASELANSGGDNYDAMDFVNMTMTPHAPLMWAYNAARGQPNEIGPFTPLSRTAKNVATMMGVKDWSNSPYNIEGRIRKEMGLPAFDKWDDYRVAREISNMAGDGNADIEKVKEAMELAALVESGKMEQSEATELSELYEEAVYRANQEYAGGLAGTFLGALGIPVKSYPTGEAAQRQLKEQFSKAYDAYNAGDVDALTDFFDEHPEYESRLALFKKPEERLQNFMIDNIWARWNDMPKVHQDELKEQLGPNFSDFFVNKETRNYESLTPQQMQMWLKLMGGKQVGRLDASTEALLELNQIRFTEPETAWRVDTFYEMRNANFPDWYKLQNQYYNLPEGAKRSEFIKSNPQLKGYWDARRGWMEKNPDLVRFLTDDEKQLKKYANQRRDPEFAVPTAQEIAANISQPNIELIQQWTAGQTLPYSTDRYLDMLAQQYGMPKRQLLGILTGR